MYPSSSRTLISIAGECLCRALTAFPAPGLKGGDWSVANERNIAFSISRCGNIVLGQERLKVARDSLLVKNLWQQVDKPHQSPSPVQI